MKKLFVQRDPFIVPTDDNKLIAEHFGLASDGNPNISIARMEAPSGWSEPFQTPEFDEYTLIIRGRKQIEIDGEELTLEAGQSVLVPKGSRVKYSNPFEESCEYVAICKPAFSIEMANREI